MSDYTDVAKCRDCGHEYKLRAKGDRGHRNMDMGRHAGLVCIFCGSTRVTIKKEKTSG
jgi:hypothetical protein